MRPEKEDKKIVMFDRYVLKLDGAGSETSTRVNMVCQVDFLKKVPLSTDFDSIPIFVIDSFCFVGSCLDSSFCLVPRSGYEKDTSSFSSEDYPRKRVYEGRVFPEDLYWGERYIYPTGYYLDGPRKAPIPLKCKDHSIDMVIHVRLVDRVSGGIIARKAREVKLNVWNRTYLQAE